VRNETDGRPVKFLEYEAHAPMAEVKMREIGAGLRGRWPGVKRVAMLHRVGRLEIGEASVLIAVSAAHRGDAFEACRHAIDTLKRTVPVWKKEHVDHQLRPASSSDGDFVRVLGARLGVPVDVATVTVDRRESLEAAARTARHAALETWAARIGARRIALGHTADDQAETVLMRLVQGAGVRGLAGIPPVRGR